MLWVMVNGGKWCDSNLTVIGLLRLRAKTEDSDGTASFGEGIFKKTTEPNPLATSTTTGNEKALKWSATCYKTFYEKRKISEDEIADCLNCAFDVLPMPAPSAKRPVGRKVFGRKTAMHSRS